MSTAAASGGLYRHQLGTSGSFIACLPGLGLTTRYWESRITPLAESHRVLLVDLLGFGKSPKPWTTYSVERHVAELHRVLADLGPLTLVGHSLGAILAVAYAERYPANVTGLVLLGLPYFGSAEQAKRFLRSRSVLDRWVMTNMLFASIACVLTRHVMRRLLPKLLDGMPREVIEDYVEHTWRSATSTVREVVYGYDLAAAANRLPPRLPVLLLHGQRDATAPLSGVQDLVRRHSRWKLHVLPNADHHLLLRDREWCVSQVLAFIDGPRSWTLPDASECIAS